MQDWKDWKKANTTSHVFDLPTVREYAEGMMVQLDVSVSSGRWVISASNEGGYNGTEVDLFDLMHALGVDASTLVIPQQMWKAS